MGRSLKDTVEGMASLSPKRGKTHAWWAVGEAVLAVYEDGNEDAIRIMEEVFERRNDDEA